MLRGHIDRLTSAGLFEGWAIDEAAPLRPLAVAIVDAAGREVAAGFAHLYERDEAARHRGSDWAAFRLRASVAAARLRGGVFALRAGGPSVVVAGNLRPPWVDRAEPSLDGLEAVAAYDPTVADIGALDACAATLAAFTASRGLDTFVRAAHRYVLGRPADPQAFIALRNALHEGLLTPLDLLRALADSAEYRRNPRALAAPNSDGFPFAVR